MQEAGELVLEVDAESNDQEEPSDHADEHGNQQLVVLHWFTDHIACRRSRTRATRGPSAPSRVKGGNTLRTRLAYRLISLATSAAVGKRQHLTCTHATHLYPIVAPPPYVEVDRLSSGHLLVCIAS